MFPNNEPPFGGAANGGPSGPFSGGSDFSGPPPADGIFDAAFEELEELSSDAKVVDATQNKDKESNVLDAGLHFFEGMKKM